MAASVEPTQVQELDGFKRSKKVRRWRMRTGERTLLLLTGDLLAGGLAILVSLYLWAQEDWFDFSFEFLNYRAPAWFFFLPILWVVLMVEMYDGRRVNRRLDTLRGVGMAALISFILYTLVYFISDPKSLNRRGVAIFIVAASLFTLAWRYLYISIFTAPQFMRRALVIGAGKAGCVLADLFNDTWPPPYRLIGLIDDDPYKLDKDMSGYRVLGGGGQLLEVIQRNEITDLVIAISGEMNGTLFQSILDAQESGIEITTFPVVYEEHLNRVPIFLLESDWIIRSFVDQARSNVFYELAKRLIDIVGGSVGLLAAIITFPMVGIAILLDSGWPIFFTQTRLGRGGDMYRIYKYRTMIQDSEKDGLVRVTIDNDNRITRVGMFLRRSHLDELPQFLNVLLGDMSLVGPRAEQAELVNHLQKKIPFYRARLLVKPGITGWAQVNFGYASTVEDTGIKLEYDLYYIKHRSLILDGVILLRTAGPVFGLRGQ